MPILIGATNRIVVRRGALNRIRGSRQRVERNPCRAGPAFSFLVLQSLMIAASPTSYSIWDDSDEADELAEVERGFGVPNG